MARRNLTRGDENGDSESDVEIELDSGANQYQSGRASRSRE